MRYLQEMKKHTRPIKVSPSIAEWSDHVKTKVENGNDIGSLREGESFGENIAQTTILRVEHATNAQHGSIQPQSSKISASNVKLAFAKDNHRNETQTSKMWLLFSSMQKLICLPQSCFKVEFTCRQLETIYQRYYRKQKLDRILYIILLDFAVNLCLIAMYSTVSFDKSNQTQVNRIIVTSTFGAINLCLVILHFLKLFPRRILDWLPLIVWFAVFVQLQVDLAIGYDPLVPSDSVGMFLFFMFISNVILPAGLTVCTALAFITAVGHVVITSLLSEKNREYLARQLGANILLFVCANILGTIDFSIADRKQRRSVLETRQSLEVKISLESENLKQRRLLHSVLPKHVAAEMVKGIDATGAFSKEGEFKKLIVKRHEACSILFADIVGFTELSSKCTAEELIITLNELFANFDKLGTKNKCQRIKILGDCYYCIAGLDDNKQHALCAVEMGRDMIKHIAKVRKHTGVKTLDMRVGIHTGSILAGVLGKIKWQFDAWSNDVTLANSMESGGIPGRVHISESTFNCVQLDYVVEPGDGHKRNDFIKEQGIKTYLIVKKKTERQEKMNSSVSQESVDSLWLTEPSKKEKRRTSSQSINPTKQWQDKERIFKKDELDLRRVSLFGEDDEEEGDTSVTMRHSEQNLNKLLSDVLEERDGGVKEKMNPITLRFHNEDIELQYALEKQEMSGESLFGLCVVIVFCFFVELTILPRSLKKDLTFSLGLVFLSIATIITCAACSPKYFPRFMVEASNVVDGSKPARTLLASLCVIILAATEFIDLLECQTTSLSESQLEQQAEQRHNKSESLNPSSTTCEYPQYFSHNGILILLGISVVVQLSFSLKGLLSFGIVAAYCIVNIFVKGQIFDSYDHFVHHNLRTSYVARKYFSSAILLLAFLILVLHGREVERTARLLFLWKMEAFEKKTEVEKIRERNGKLVDNILPKHVADYFLQNQNKDETELYSQSYNYVTVIFASIPNFDEFYSEELINDCGKECIRFLNEIINDFDEVLAEPRFERIEKIKTIKSTYMAAAGLHPENESEVSEPWRQLVNVVDFALALRDKLESINQECFNQFVLRVGICQGPVVAGVIGAKKPHYDIWGNTVNVASRMESTGKAGYMQVTEQTYEILKDKGFKFIYRGPVKVKGKGQLVTYYLTGRDEKQKPFQPTKYGVVM